MFTIMLGCFALIFCRLCNSVIGAIIVVVLATIVMLSPIEGYEERIVDKTVVLLNLRRDNCRGTCCYVEKHKSKVTYAFDNRNVYDIMFEAYEEKTVHGRIKVYEAEECATPILKVYKSKPKREMFTFAFIPKKEYVFLLPKGTLEDRKDMETNVTSNIV